MLYFNFSKIKVSTTYEGCRVFIIFFAKKIYASTIN